MKKILVPFLAGCALIATGSSVIADTTKIKASHKTNHQAFFT